MMCTFRVTYKKKVILHQHWSTIYSKGFHGIYESTSFSEFTWTKMFVLPPYSAKFQRLKWLPYLSFWK